MPITISSDMSQREGLTRTRFVALTGFLSVSGNGSILGNYPTPWGHRSPRERPETTLREI